MSEPTATFNERAMTLGMSLVSVYFSLMTLRAARLLWRFSRLRPTALVSWVAPAPLWRPYLMGLGFLAAALAVILWERPFVEFYSQAVMAFYFILVVPALGRIRLGLYRDGVWTETGFVRWSEISRVGFKEQPEIVLVVVDRHSGAGYRLGVPAGEYGAVRRLLQEQARSGALRLEPVLAA